MNMNYASKLSLSLLISLEILKQIKYHNISYKEGNNIIFFKIILTGKWTSVTLVAVCNCRMNKH